MERRQLLFWKGQKFEGTDKGLKSTDERIISIRYGVQRQFEELDLSEILSRIKIVKLSVIPEEDAEGENPMSFLAVSWHGPHRKSTVPKKHDLFKGLQKFVKKVSEKEGNIPFIIGGDFNLNTSKEQLALSDGVAVTSYELSPRDQRRLSDQRNYIPCKDNFIFSYPCTRVAWTSPLDFTSPNEQTEAAGDPSREEQSEVENTSVYSSSGVVNLLDHDPVVGVLQIFPRRTSSTVVQNLTERFQASVKVSNE